MSTTLTITSRDVRGSAILDHLEAQVGVYPFLTDSDGRRAYAVEDVRGFFAALDRLEPTGRDHVSTE